MANTALGKTFLMNFSAIKALPLGIFIAIGGIVMLSNNNNSFAGDAVRKPAVAGQFYTANASELKKEVQGYIAAGGSKKDAYPKMIISPHAGYVFSGPVAGKAYATIDKNTTTVILIGPSHHEWFSGVSISDADYYATPLGNVALAKDIIAKLRKNPLVHYISAADGPEHSLEVQLPFLQVALPSFSLVPIITGNVDPKEVAELVSPFISASTLVIASSDLSHYHGSLEAKAIDKTTIQTILSGNAAGNLDACGETAIRVIMHLAKKSNLIPELLDARNSYETAPQYGSQDRVVGYASIGFFKNIK
jgi:AmmeMemoRadiSam system protein B